MKFTEVGYQYHGMSWLVGYIDASYQKLVEVFGEPTYRDTCSQEKVQVEWNLKFADGTIATIYNWKDYDDGTFCTTVDSYKWHIGGNDRGNPVLRIEELLK